MGVEIKNYGVAFFVLGTYFISGATYTFVTAKWFPGFPIQLDVVRLIFGDGQFSIYAEGVVAAGVGVAALWAALRSSKNESGSRE